MVKRPSDGNAYRPYKRYRTNTFKKTKGMSRKKAWKPIIPYQQKETHCFKKWGAPIAPLRFVSGDVGALTVKPLVVTFSLAQVEGYNDLVALYDQFRIRAVSVKYTALSIPVQNINSGSSVAAQPLTLYSVLDYDDDTALTSATIARQYNSCLVHQYNENSKPHVRYFTPSCLQQVYESNVATAYAPKFGQWLDVNDNATPHYGIKFLLTALSSVTTADLTAGYQVDVCYYLEFKNTR